MLVLLLCNCWIQFQKKVTWSEWYIPSFRFLLKIVSLGSLVLEGESGLRINIKDLKHFRNCVRTYRRQPFFKEIIIPPSSNTLRNSHSQKTKESPSKNINFAFNLIPQKATWNIINMPISYRIQYLIFV